MWRVLAGWGDCDSPDDCWGVEYLDGTYSSCAEADDAAERHYESSIADLMREYPADWKSYWVRAVEERTQGHGAGHGGE